MIYISYIIATTAFLLTWKEGN